MKKLRTLTLEIIINKNKEEVWDLLFNQYGEVNNFNPLIVGSHHSKGPIGEVGCERQCNLDNKNSVQERITSASGTNSFNIDIIKGGLPMMDQMKANWNLISVGSLKTKVVFTFRYNTKPSFMAGLMAGSMTKKLFSMLVGLKFYLETGDIVTKRNIKSIMKEFNKLDNDDAFSAKHILAQAV